MITKAVSNSREAAFFFGRVGGPIERAALELSRSALYSILANAKYYAVFPEQQPLDVSLVWLVPQHAGFSSTIASV
jgi:hypothetical protein